MSSFSLRIPKEGLEYRLASAKVDRNSGIGGKHQKVKEIKLLYIQSRCLASDLEKIANFSVMKPEKVVARLGEIYVGRVIVSMPLVDLISTPFISLNT